MDNKCSGGGGLRRRCCCCGSMMFEFSKRFSSNKKKVITVTPFLDCNRNAITSEREGERDSRGGFLTFQKEGGWIYTCTHTHTPVESMETKHS